MNELLRGDSPMMANEVFASRMKATDMMRQRAKEDIEKGKRLIAQANSWISLAKRLDEIEEAGKKSGSDGAEGSIPYIGAGSQDENFLWAIAAGYTI